MTRRTVGRLRFWGRRAQPWVSVDCGRCGERIGRVLPDNRMSRGWWPDTDDELGWFDMLGCTPDHRLRIIGDGPLALRAVCPRCGMDARCSLPRFAPAWLAAWEAGPPSVLRIHPDGTPE